MRSYLEELGRPWKLATLAAGMSWLFYGALNYGISDWDMGISIIMGSLTYLTAPWSAKVVAGRQWNKLPLALLYWYFTVDGCYWIYHTAMGNEMFRGVNFVASTTLYWLCGFIWLPRGSLKEIIQKKAALF